MMNLRRKASDLYIARGARLFPQEAFSIYFNDNIKFWLIWFYISGGDSFCHVRRSGNRSPSRTQSRLWFTENLRLGCALTQPLLLTWIRPLFVAKIRIKIRIFRWNFWLQKFFERKFLSPGIFLGDFSALEFLAPGLRIFGSRNFF